MQFELITTDDSFAALREEWNRLACDDPLASWEWRYAWWQVYGHRRSLAVGVVRRDDQVLGIAPCFTEHGPIQGQKLCWLGSGKACTDYQRFLVDPRLTPTQQAIVIERLVDAVSGKVARRAQQDLWDLDGVLPENPATLALVESLRRRGFMVHAEPVESSWIVDLPSDWETFVAGAKRAIRRKINKAQRRAASPDVQYFTATTPAEVAAFWPEFVRLHEARFSVKVSDGGCFADPLFAAFLPEAVQRLSDRGAIRLSWCEVGGRAISAQLYLLGGRTASMYQSGFDPKFASLEPGHLLYSRVFRDLIEAGFTRLDFLRGNESYKADWNATAVPLSRLYCVPPRRTSQLRHQTYQFARSLKRAAKQTFGRRESDVAQTVGDAESESTVNS